MPAEDKLPVLKIDEKWSVSYDPANNDMPVTLYRYDEEAAIDVSDWKNDQFAMFYALLSAREAAFAPQGDVGELVGRLERADAYMGISRIVASEAAALITAQAAQIATLTAERDAARLDAERYCEGQVLGQYRTTNAEAEVKRLREVLIMIAHVELSFLEEVRDIARAALAEDAETEHG